MTRTTLFSFVAVAVIATACERHPASELAEHEGTSETTPAITADAPAPAPAPASATVEPGKAPTFFPTNK